MADAQTPTPTPDPVLEAAQREAALAKARADRAEEEKKEAEADLAKLKVMAQPLGTPSITAPNGNVTTDSSGFVETQILSEEASNVVCGRLSEELLTQSGIKTIVIYNATDMTALTSYTAVLQELEQFGAEFDAVRLQASNTQAGQLKNDAEAFLTNPDAAVGAQDLMTAMAAPAIATGIVKSVGELVQLFRSTTTFSNKTVTISEDMIVSTLVKKMPATQFFYPALFPPNFLMAADKTEIIVAFEKIKSGKNAATDDLATIDKLITTISSAKTKSEEELETATGSDIQKIKKRIAKAGVFIVQLESLKKRIQFLLTTAEQVITSIETPDSTTKISPFGLLTRTSHLKNLLTSKDTYTLHVTVAANGTTKIRQWLFLDAKVRHSAGATLTYQLFDQNGLIQKGNSIKFYFDWKSAEQIRACVNKACLTEDRK